MDRYITRYSEESYKQIVQVVRIGNVRSSELRGEQFNVPGGGVGGGGVSFFRIFLALKIKKNILTLEN